MGESVAAETSAQRVPTLALTVFGFVLFPAVMAAVQTAMMIPHLPDSQAGLGWITFLMMIPSVITGIISGLTAALGAYIGKRMSTNAAGGPVGWKVNAGAGLGGALGSVPFLLYLTWWYQNGPGPWILVLGYVGIFGAYAGFAALWNRRGVHRVRASV
jgi:hypothetical protein